MFGAGLCITVLHTVILYPGVRESTQEVVQEVVGFTPPPPPCPLPSNPMGTYFFFTLLTLKQGLWNQQLNINYVE